MRTLVIGTGGREHALARSLALDPDAEVHAAPGNPGGTTAALFLPPVGVTVMALRGQYGTTRLLDNSPVVLRKGP